MPKVGKETNLGTDRAWLKRKGPTHSSVGTLKHCQLLLRGRVLVGRDHSLEGCLGDLPQLVMLILNQNNDAGALAVERGGSVEDGVADNLLHLLVVDGRPLLEGVVGTAGLDRIEIVGRHGAGEIKKSVYWWRT
jgi:hypothetical protein